MILKEAVLFCLLTFLLRITFGQDEAEPAPAEPTTTVKPGAAPPVPEPPVTLEGGTLYVAAIESDLLFEGELTPTEITPQDVKDFISYFTYSIDLWMVLVEKLRFTIKFVFPTRNREKESSLKKLVVDDLANATLSAMVYTNNTEEAVYTPPVDIGKYKLYIKTPTSEASWSSLGSVFRPLLWVTIVLAIVFMGFTLVGIEHIGYKAKLGTYLEAPADTGQLFIVILGNFCYQGAINIASGCAGRVVLFSGLMCGYLVYVSYSTLVISQLTAVKLANPFETLQEMALKHTYKLFVPNDQTILESIELSRKNKSNALASVWDSLLPKKIGMDNMYNEEVYALQKLCAQDSGVLASDQKMTTRKMRKAKCSATPLRDTYFTSNLAFVLNKKCPHNAILIKTLNRMRETGIMHRWRKYWDFVDGLNREPDKAATSLKPISLPTILPIFGVLGFGMGLSVVVLIIELIMRRSNDLYNKRIRKRQAEMFHKRSRPPLPMLGDPSKV